MKKFRCAFTLAESLITLAIIGIVAAIVLPAILDIGDDKTFNTQSDVFGAQLFTALKTMNFKGDLARLSSTEEFVQNLSKYIKITKTCPKDEAYKCFSKKISTGRNGQLPEVVKDLDLQTALDIGHDNWRNSNIMGVQFANGIDALVAYNTSSCAPNSVNQGKDGIWSSDIFGCIGIVFDVNGDGTPNELKKDIRNVNAPIIGQGSTIVPCDAYSENLHMCITFVGASVGGINCLYEENAPYCSNFYNNCKRDNSTSIGCVNNRVAEAYKTCRMNGLYPATIDHVKLIINDLGKDYIDNVFTQFGVNSFFLLRTDGNYAQIDAVNSTGGSGWTNNVGQNIAVVCIKPD